MARKTQHPRQQACESMSTPFPISIDEMEYLEAKALAAEISRRGRLHILQEAAWTHPSTYFERWMRADESGRTTAAILEASTLVVASTDCGDALEHAVMLVGNKGDSAFLASLLERVEGGLPASQFWGTRRALTIRLLERIPVAMAQQLPDRLEHFYDLLCELGETSNALSYALFAGPHSAVMELTRRWLTEEDIDLHAVASWARVASAFPGFITTFASAFAEADTTVKESFLEAVEEPAHGLSQAELDAIRSALAGEGEGPSS